MSGLDCRSLGSCEQQPGAELVPGAVLWRSDDVGMRDVRDGATSGRCNAQQTPGGAQQAGLGHDEWRPPPIVFFRHCDIGLGAQPSVLHRAGRPAAAHPHHPSPATRIVPLLGAQRAVMSLVGALQPSCSGRLSSAHCEASTSGRGSRLAAAAPWQQHERRSRQQRRRQRLAVAAGVTAETAAAPPSTPVMPRGGRGPASDPSAPLSVNKVLFPDIQLQLYDPAQPATFDLVVVGSGPAGLAVADRVAQAGFKVRWCWRWPGHSAVCGLLRWQAGRPLGCARGWEAASSHRAPSSATAAHPTAPRIAPPRRC